MRVLDLFCGAGGAAMGLHRAWPSAEIVGVDIVWQPRYPFSFRMADAFLYLREMAEYFDFIWAGPVCKRYTVMSAVRPNLAQTHADQIPALRELLVATGKPYVIENVPGAPLRTCGFLCGFGFGLPLIRHRYFESNFLWLAPPHLNHRGRKHLCVVGHGGPANQRRWKVAEAREAMGIDWMCRDELVEAVPPAYSEFIARQFRWN